MNRYDYKDIKPFKWFVLENFPFIEADFDALTNWQLFCKIGKEINRIIASQNEVGNTVEIYTQNFVNLYNYVHDYFENLDVQEEINNKLDEMVEDGTLQDLLLDYISTQKIYPTHQDMLNDTNLKNNSKCKTLGYYTINDGGGGDYIIVDDIPQTHYDILQNNLYAMLITKDTVTPEVFGAYGDGVHDDTNAIQNACNTLKEVHLSKSYLVSVEIEINSNFIMENFSTIIASENFSGETVISVSKNTQKRNLQLYINVDCNGVADYGICIGKLRFSQLNLNVINSTLVGIDCNHYGIAGNGGNTFNCTVIGNSDGTSQTGVVIKNWDSTFDTVVTQDVLTGVDIQEGEFICKYLHSWLSNNTAIDLWDNSKVLKNIGYRRIFIDWFYQDSVKYGIYGGCYGKIKYFEYNLNLNNPDYFSNEINVYSPTVVTRLFIDIFTNIKNENSLLKYVLNSSNANEFGVLIKNGVSTDINVIKDYQPFNDLNDAPQIGKFYVTYNTVNLPIDQGGYVVCEIIESCYVQTYYSVNYKNKGNYYKRLRKNNESEWSDWFKYSPAAN